MKNIKPFLFVFVILLLVSPVLAQLDTMIVGYSSIDYQKAGSVGRTIDNFPGEYGYCYDPDLLVWIKEQDERRYAAYTIFDCDNGYNSSPAGAQINGHGLVDYVSLATYYDDVHYYSDFYRYVTAYGKLDSNTVASCDWIDFPEIFLETAIDNIDISIIGTPHICITENGIIHIVAHQMNIDSTNARGLYYIQCQYSEDGYHLEPIGSFTEITPYGLNLSADIAVTEDGSRVAIAAVMHRDAVLNDQAYAPDNFNGDMVVWISEDGGETWDWDNPINITDFQGPEDGEDRDTLRAYNDVNVLFDANGTLHVAFVVHGFHTAPERYTTSTSLIYHWDEAFEVTHLAVDARELDSHMSLGGGMRTVQRPTMAYDANTHILFMVYQRAGDPAFPEDCSDDGYANSEIFVTASPPFPTAGRLWSTPVNITNTHFEGEGGAAAGECKSERDPCVAIRNDDEYLHITYLLDLDAGTAGMEEGNATNNPVVFQRYEKTTLIDEFEAFAAWVPNVPLHHDSTDFWTDPLHYSWELHGNSFNVTYPPLRPGIFSDPSTIRLGTIYPGATTSMDHVIINNTLETVEILNIQYIADNNLFSIDLHIGDMIAPVTMHEVTTTFSPEVSGNFADEIVIRTSSTNHPQFRIHLLGQAAIPIPASIHAYADSQNGNVDLSWEYDALEDFDSLYFNIYRDNELIDTSNTLSYIDHLENMPNALYAYWITAVAEGHESLRSDTYYINWQGLGVDDIDTDLFPTEWAVSALFPNPFNPTIHAEIAVPSSEHVQVNVFDILGRTVATLVNRELEAGYHTLHWTAEGPSGVYFLVTANSSGWQEINRVVFLK